MASSPSEERRNCLELPWELMASIMSRLVAVDILMTAQFVCKSWLEISMDPLVWRKIDMYKAGDLDLEIDLVAMCCHAVDRSSGRLADINIEYFGNDELLEYIADRSNELKRLRLACCYHLSDDRMKNVIAKFPLLEELDLTLCPFSVEFLESVGRSCPRLKSFKLNCQAYRIWNTDLDPDEEAVHNSEAVSIGKNMPGLHHLQLIGNTMTNMGLEAILKGCPDLKSLDLRRCVNLSLNEAMLKRCKERVKHLRYPWDPTDDYDFVAGPDDGSDMDSYDDFHHWFSHGDGDHLELMDDELGHSDHSDHSDVSDDDALYDYDYDDYL